MQIRVPIRPALACGALALVAAAWVSARPSAPATEPASQPADENVKVYAEGVRIDWARRTVDLDATVCLREGMLELFACSPHTKEHESIVVLHARPLHIFEALGLIGLEPGSPPTYDPATDRSTPARGAPLRIDVAVSEGGREVVRGIHEWMRFSKDQRPVPPQRWVFAGSRRLENGRLAADSEGTLICVVDFDAALIALPENYSADDELLWVEANPERVPPRGTPCKVRIAAAEPDRNPVPATQPAR